jgi:hypothetical protein
VRVSLDREAGPLLALGTTNARAAA